MKKAEKEAAMANNKKELLWLKYRRAYEKCRQNTFASFDISVYWNSSTSIDPREEKKVQIWKYKCMIIINITYLY